MKFILTCVLVFVVIFVLGYLIDLYNKWKGKRLINKMLIDVKAGKVTDLENENNGVVHVTDKGIVLGENQDMIIDYDKVNYIDVYKRDLFTTDLICLSFSFTENNKIVSLEIHEEMKGYKETLNRLHEHFPNINEDWFTDVAFPAFETNLTRIWTKT